MFLSDFIHKDIHLKSAVLCIKKSDPSSSFSKGKISWEEATGGIS